MRRRNRRNPMTNQESDINRNKFREKTYYNYSYSNHNGLKVAIISGAVILTIALVFIITKINRTPETDVKAEVEATFNPILPTPTPVATESAKLPDETPPAETPTVTDTPQDVQNSGESNPTNLQMPSYSQLDYEQQSSRVKIMQERLMELGYMEQDETTALFGKGTLRALNAFQRQHKLPKTENATTDVLRLLFSADAQEYRLDEGAKGDDVIQFQDSLVELGYMEEHTGYYGSETAAAVREFQSKNGLNATGVADRETIDLLYSGRAERK